MNLSTQTNDEPLEIPAGLFADRPGNNSRFSGAESASSNASAEPHARIFGLSLAAVLAACLVLNAASPSTRVCQQSDRDFVTTGTNSISASKSHRSCAGRRFARRRVRNDPFQGVRNERGRRGARLLMKAAVVSLPLRNWLLKRPDWLDHQTAVAMTFAVKTFAASLLALYIAFWAGLDDPRWSFLTVFVVSQPDSGLVLAKSFYRILGTIAGVLVTIALVFGLAQYGELFVAAIAVWICFCNFAARAVRNFASYGFQLAGYTVAIVAIPAALEPSWSLSFGGGALHGDRARYHLCGACQSFDPGARPFPKARRARARSDSPRRRLRNAPARSRCRPRACRRRADGAGPRLISTSRPCSVRRISRAPTRVFSTSRCAD